MKTMRIDWAAPRTRAAVPQMVVIVNKMRAKGIPDNDVRTMLRKRFYANGFDVVNLDSVLDSIFDAAGSNS